MKKTPSSRTRQGAVGASSARPALDAHGRVVAAARGAVRQAIKAHKAEGQPIIVWRDGKVVRVPARLIKL